MVIKNQKRCLSTSSSSRQKPGSKPSNRGSRVGEVKQTGFNGASSSPRYWRWNGADWENISRSAFDNAESNNSSGGNFDVFSGEVGDVLRYPEELTVDVETDYLSFDFWRYKPNSGQLTWELKTTLLREMMMSQKFLIPAKQLPKQIVIAMPQDIGTIKLCSVGRKIFWILRKRCC